jgi:hypothetical protein
MNGLLKFSGWLFFPMLRAFELPFYVRFPAIVMLGLTLGVWGWHQSKQRDPPEPVPATLREAVDAACSDIPRSLPRPQRALCPTLVLPLVGDRELLVLQGIRRALDRDGGYRPIGKGLPRELMDDLFDLAGTPPQPVTDAQTALGIAKTAGAEVVVFGQVDRLKLQDGHAEVSFSIQAFESSSGRPLLAGDFLFPKPGSLARVTTLHWGFVLGVLIVAVFWPVLTIPVMARVLRMESNAATLMTIVGVTAVPALVAWPLFFGTAVVAGRVIVFAVALLLVGLWSALVMSWVAARAEESV